MAKLENGGGEGGEEGRDREEEEGAGKEEERRVGGRGAAPRSRDLDPLRPASLP